MFSLSPPRIPIQKKKNTIKAGGSTVRAQNVEWSGVDTPQTVTTFTFSCGVVYKVKVEDERRAKILGALNGAEAIKDQWMHKSTFQLPTISGTFLHPWQEKA